jgi:hypothetical protein
MRILLWRTNSTHRGRICHQNRKRRRYQNQDQMYPSSFLSRSQVHSLQARKTKIAGAKRQVVRPQALRHLIPLVWRESVQLRAYSAEQAPTRRSLRVHRLRSVWHRVIFLPVRWQPLTRLRHRVVWTRGFKGTTRQCVQLFKLGYGRRRIAFIGEAGRR